MLCPRSNLDVPEVKPHVLFQRANLYVSEVKPHVLFQRSNLYVSPPPPQQHFTFCTHSSDLPQAEAALIDVRNTATLHYPPAAANLHK
jgi:hypothetical protein